MDKQSKIILISGPTASGKSSFALKIARKINGEIINADSMQVYKQLKVLTARPNKEEQKNVKIDPKYVGKKMSRNEPCFCGSNKKYKHCCGRF